MNPTAEAQSVAQSFVPEGTPRPAGLTPEQQHQRDETDRFKQSFNATKDSEDPYAALREIPEQPKFDNAQIEKVIDVRIGTDVTPVEMPDPAAGIAGNEQGIRKQQALEATALADLVREKGYDAIKNPVVKDGIRNDVVKNVLDRRPAFVGLSADEKNAIAEAMLRNPDYQAKLGELLAGRLQIDMDPRLVAGLKEAKTKFDSAEAAYKGKSGEVKDKKDQIKQNKTELDRYKIDKDETMPDGTVVHVVGDKLGELRLREALEDGEKLELDKDIKFLQGKGLDAAAIDALRKDIRDRISKGTYDETKATEEERVAHSLVVAEEDLDRLEDLRQEQRDLVKAEVDLAKELTALQAEVKTLRDERNKAEEDFDTANTIKDTQEEAYVAGLKNLIKDAGRGVLDDELKQRAENYKQWLTEQKKAITDNDEKKITDHLDRRMERWERKGKNNIFKINKQGVDNLYTTLTVGAGPEAILRSSLMEGLTINATDSPAEVARKQQEIDRIETRLKDKDFVDKECAIIAGRVLEYKIQTSKLYEGDVRVLLHKKWGESAIDTAINGNQKLVDTLNKLYGEKGDITGGQPGHVERIRREAGGNWLKIIALILASGIAGGAVAGRYAAQEGGRSFQGQGNY